MNIENTRRIARNTALLYVRMLVMMLVTMYASRIVLRTLGAADNDLYSLIADSFVALFWFLNTAMAAATQRFLNFEIGQGDSRSVSRVFSMSVNIHVGVAVIVLLLGETVGLWFVNNKLDILAERMTAANWVYQFALLTSCFNILRVPYNATIIAHERMSFYAVMSIAEAVLRLGAVFMLVLLAGDKLILYAALTALVVLLVTLIYRWHCKRTFDTCDYRFERDKPLMKKMVGFSGWSLLGSGAGGVSQHGVNVMLNMFVGRGLNLPMGFANQISSAVYAFVLNFQIAFNPQIVKSYAAQDTGYFRYLIFRASKYSYFLLLLIAVPVVLCTRPLLELWLGADMVPAHTASFSRLIMGAMLIDALSGPLWTAVQATGRIRNYQILISSIIFLNLPLSYLALKMGYAPESVLVIKLTINAAAFTARVLYMGSNLAFPAGEYLRRAVLPALAVTAAAVPLPALVAFSTAGLTCLVVTTLVSCVSVGLAVYVIGMGRGEREFVMSRINERLGRKKND